MKYIRKKLIKGNKYYYFEYPLFSARTGKRTSFSRYIGTSIPKNIKERMKDFFDEVADISIRNAGKVITDYFLYTGITSIEKYRFLHHCLSHELFKKEFTLFRNLFYILFVLNSNRAEGSRVTRLNIERVLQRRLVKPQTMIDREIINSVSAINFAFSKEMKWNEKSIKLVHKKLFHDIDPDMAGRYKRQDNVAPGDKPTTSPEEVSKEMKGLLAWFGQERRRGLYPSILALKFYWKFEAIHPFQDGNGRAGRILLNALLIENAFMPVIFFSQNHRTHCNAIARAREGYEQKLAKHFVYQIKKTKQNIEAYKRKGIIRGGSRHVGKWEYQKGQIRIYY
ncbi:Fic family protein [Patescibacteria group bacterium AH-259-L07]|nr:Fic family protein [Patescibacteria group bacterium AH-259-L07]